MGDHGETLSVEPLTEREQEVLELLAQGKSNRELAEALVLSVNTVKWHNRRIYRKLGVENREQAAQTAHKLGMVQPEDGRTPVESNLPAAFGKFIGRQAELAELDRLLAERHVRLITITGVGGAGKSRLAYMAARREVERQPPLFTDGVYATSLADYDSPEQLLPAIADAVALPSSDRAQEGQAELDRLTDYLQKKKALLVLDNFEHLLDGAGLISDLLQRTAALRLLITSRERLNLREEHVFPLAGFTAGHWQGLDEAESDPFVQLFLHSARRVRPEYELALGELEHLQHLWETTAGLPLAVELAASWVEVLPLPQIAAEIRQDIDFLQSELRNVPARQRSIRAVFEVSWQRLDPALQETFCRLSLFRGGFTRRAAQEVAGASLRDLAMLSAKSFLQYEAGHDRYQIHELLRQFGQRKLQDQPDVETETRRSHATYYCRYLHQRREEYFGERAGEALAELEQERANVRLAWKWAARQGEVPLLDDGLRGLCTYYDRRDHVQEARELLHAASDALLLSPVKTDDDDDLARRRLLVRLLAWRGHFAPSIEEGRALLDQAKTVLRPLRSQKVDLGREEALLAYRRGTLELGAEPAASRPHLRRALSLYRKLGDDKNIARATTALGGAEWHLGNYEEAASLVRQGLSRHKALGNRTAVAHILGQLGLIEKHLGRLDAALQAHRQSYALLREMGDRSGAANMSATLAYTLCWAGDYAEARTTALDGLQLAEEVEARRLIAYVATTLANACVHLGRHDEGRKHSERAETLARATGARQHLGWTLTYLGQLSMVSGSHEEAVAQLEEAATVLTEFGKSIWTLPLVYQVLALRQLGQLSQARQTLANALQENMEPRVFFVVVNALPAAALLVAEKGDVQRALEIDALARCYPRVANSRWFLDILDAEDDEWAASLAPDVVDAARQRGQTRDLWETAEELIVEVGEDITPTSR